MPNRVSSAALTARIRRLVKLYRDNAEICQRIQRTVSNNYSLDQELTELVHSMRSRLKDPKHLADKLRRLAKEEAKAGRAFSITEKNLFVEVYDIVGLRMLHIRRLEFPQINQRLLKLIELNGHELIKGPTARVWDDESRTYYEKLGIETRPSETMYTSVHYVIDPKSAFKLHFEVQVRTLMEEVWGEVDHSFNYPHASNSVACREQILTLARLVSSSNRLVESIYASRKESIKLRGDLKVLRAAAKTASAGASSRTRKRSH